MSSKKIKKSLILKIASALVIVIACSIIINLLTATKTLGNVVEEVWDGTTASSFSAGNGTKDNPYQIRNGKELSYLKERVETNKATAEEYYVLMNDIDLGNQAWTGIGREDTTGALHIFEGHFDGNSYTIKNAKLEQPTMIHGSEYYGLFTMVEHATIENLNMSNIEITPSVTKNKLVIGTLLAEIKESSEQKNITNIKNIALQNIKLDLTKTSQNSTSQIASAIGITATTSNITNLYVNSEINSNYSIGIGKVFGSLKTPVKNIANMTIIDNFMLANIKEYSEIKEEIELVDSYQLTSDETKLLVKKAGKELSITELIQTLNTQISEQYMWIAEKNNLRITKTPEAETNLLQTTSKVFSFTSKQQTIPLHDSGITDTTVYVNDLQSDYDYYMGKNYTDSNGTLPTLEDKNIYKDTNLVKVHLAYQGEDINNPTVVGHVSLEEQQKSYIYYKYYDVKNGYITIELIDNPFTDRPNNKAFNGWITDYKGAQVTYDHEYYQRKVRIPVTYTNGLPDDISITFYANWTEATVTQLTTNSSTTWQTAFSKLKDSGMEQIGGKTPIYEDLSNYYIAGEITYGEDYPSSAIDSSGNKLSGSCRSWWGGCSYYEKSSSEYDENQTYYRLVNNRLQQYTPQIIGYEQSDTLADGMIAAGYYKQVTIPRNSSLTGYYDEKGIYQEGGTCTSTSGCTYYELLQYYDDNGNANIVDNNTNQYYYLVTRDTNIAVLRTNLAYTWNSSQNKPFTLTSIHNDNDYRNSAYFNINNLAVNIYADTTIENVKLYTTMSKTNSEATPSGSGATRTIYGRWNNLKLGRGLLQNGNYVAATAVVGGSNTSTGSSSAPTKYRVIIESGIYNSLALSTGSTGGTDYLNAQGIYGNDYDRVTNNNDNLEVRHCASGSWAGTIRGKNNTDIALALTVKSGGFGTNGYDYATGIYVGGRNGGTHYSPRSITVEGGYIYNLIGGPLTASSQTNYNDTYMYIKGGSIDMVIGGAGRTETYGNRIIQVTDGTINYSVFGGSNGIEGSNQSNSLGTLNGTPYVYIGGTATIGNDTYVANNSTESGAEAGSVFGIGNGRNGFSGIGSCDNSNVIIAGNATVKRNVYGGGNYGATGYSSSTNSNETNLRIKGGIIEGSVYGGGNNNGAGTSTKVSTIDMEMTGGTVKGSLYGGSRTSGTVYGSTTVNVINGTIETDIYGGGEGNNTYVARSVAVSIGTKEQEGQPIINNSVYGGSAYGSVNNTTKNTTVSSYPTTVTINQGIIKGSVFGGGKGSSSYTPYVAGDVTVTVNAGNIGQVFGGNDAAGSPNGTDTVYLNGGIIGNVFGGGNNTGQNSSNVFLQGATVTNLFGGSNASGIVTTTNVTITSGTVNKVYGGNNIGGSSDSTKVYITGQTVTEEIYGGGSLADTKSSKILLENATINDVYGGGEKASVDKTAIETKGSTLHYLFGGSNISGAVSTSNITTETTTIQSLYGGNNQGGTTETANVKVASGKITDIYGGGDHASSTFSNILIEDGTIENIYGGGNEAGLNTSTITVNKGQITNIYGGSNNSGNLTASNIKLGSNTATSKVGVQFATTVTKAESWQTTQYKNYAEITITLTNNTTAVIDDWQLDFKLPDSQVYSNYSNSDIVVEKDNYIVTSINKYHGKNSLSANGGTYSITFAVITNTEETILKSITPNIEVTETIPPTSSIYVDNIYGGNNKGGVTKTTKLEVQEGNIGNIYGGGNQAVVDTSDVEVQGATVNNIYGGGNEAGVTDSTSVTLANTNINTNVYGGGNEGPVANNTTTSITDTNILGSAYAGGNGATAIVSGNTTITVEGSTVIGSPTSVAPKSGCLFGSGNAAATGTQQNNNSLATVNLVGATIYGNVYGGANTSVVYGKTDTNIGTNAVSNKNLKENNIIIGGTVFGGGEANASGDENYDYSFISVTGAIDIKIDGKNYITNNHKFEISGSIFGSGNASSSSGTSDIYIANLGTRKAPSKNISIQRANTVILDNTVMELKGTTDRTNEYSDIKYSFNRIDELKIKNNTMLLLQQNANLLKSLKSVVDVNGKEEKASVIIDDTTKTVTKNVDNRLYMMANKNLNVTTNEAATSYGQVSGMTFFGMYNTYGNGSFSYGMYDSSVNYGDAGDAGDIIIGGSYVLGLHSLNHDITLDGFYTNSIDDAYTQITTEYVKPSPPDSNYYMWSIGLQAINYSFAMTASKYSTLGTYELSMREFSSGDTIFDVIGFNSEGLTSGVELIDASNVPKLADTEKEANSLLGLSMKTETSEWTSYGVTKMLSENNGSYTGTKEYKTDSQVIAPSLMFYLYHAKNITLNEELGTVIVSLQAKTPKNEIEYDVQLITITIDLVAKNYNDGDSYDASITYDKKYELPAATTVNITNQSQFTAYFDLYAPSDSLEDFYGRGNKNYHALVSDYALPEGTQITMLDYGSSDGKPKYYYLTITKERYEQAVQDLAQNKEITYRLSEFIKMGSTSTDNTYNDQTSNISYYDKERKRTIEEFIFIFDFKDTKTTGNHLNNHLQFELRNPEDEVVISVLGIRQTLMYFNTYESSNMVLNQEVLPASEYIYPDRLNSIAYTTSITYDQTENREAIINTNYESTNMGVNIALYDQIGNQVSSSLLTGTSIYVDNKQYFADSDGIFRIKLAGKVSNLNKTIYISPDSNATPGIYTAKFTLFASSDGLHNSYLLQYAEKEVSLTFVNSDNAIEVITNDKMKIISGETSKNEQNTTSNRYQITINQKLNNPNVRVSLYKRAIDTKTSKEYQEVSLNQVFSNGFVTPESLALTRSSEHERMISNAPPPTVTLDLNLKQSLVSGTYKLLFKLYDKNQLIEEDQEYLIINKKVT